MSLGGIEALRGELRDARAEIAALTKERDALQAEVKTLLPLYEECVTERDDAVFYLAQTDRKLAALCKERDAMKAVVEAAREAYRAHPRYGHIPSELQTKLGNALAALNAESAGGAR